MAYEKFLETTQSTAKILRPEQVRAIARGIKLGRILRQDHPEIVDLYRLGYTLPKIIEELDINLKYGVSYCVAWLGVRLTITGHNGGFKIDPYDGLIKDDERIRIGKEHHLKNSRKVGRRSYEEKKGVHGRTSKQHSEDGRKGGHKSGTMLYKEKRGFFARTPEQWSEDSKRGGCKGGRKVYEERKGIFARTAEQISEDGRKGAYSMLLSQGKTLWTDEEKDLAYQLSQQTEYQWEKGLHKGKPNLKKITQELIERGYPTRANKSVQHIILQKRKSLEGKV